MTPIAPQQTYDSDRDGRVILVSALITGPMATMADAPQIEEPTPSSMASFGLSPLRLPSK